jgi:hypothetical protein
VSDEFRLVHFPGATAYYHPLLREEVSNERPR